MRLLSVRLIIALIVGITLVSLSFSYYEVLIEKRALRKDLERRAEVLGEGLAGTVERDLEKKAMRELQRTVGRFSNREHLTGLAIYDRQGKPLAVTQDLAEVLKAAPPIVSESLNQNRGIGVFQKLGATSLHIYALPLHHEEDIIGGLAIVHDAGYINAEGRRIWRETFLSATAHVFLIMVITLLIVRWSIAGPIARTAQWIRALRMGKISFRQRVPDLQLFHPLAREVATLAESLSKARSAAENEARLRDASESLWTAERLGVHVRTHLDGGRLFVVSNREPYIHMRRGKSWEVIVPPSGLVTALEPVLRACDGTWVAHGSGDADLETVDQHSRLRVPPEDPRYSLRRVWLSKDEEAGYYYGFANEGLWPLCHIAHTRPIFRASDWEHYQNVNQKFATALLEEMSDSNKPVVLLQDYHFALLPRLIKGVRPDARVAIFWHIPWPNPEAFGICPWQRELLDGLLGADLIGFHIQSQCNNFLQTVDRALESRVDWEHFSVRRSDHLTAVKPFPISVDFVEEQPQHDEAQVPTYVERSALLKALSTEAAFLGLGVDRVDYTKGILERFLAIERFLEQNRPYQGQFTFVQIGAPSRTHIKRYHDLLAEVEAEAERINGRFQTDRWRPIVYLKRQHNHQEIQAYYRAADLCLVTSLHDGMNLVAKEFPAARHDERGVLILSCFTGAARELRDALLVNPYDIDQTAEAIHVALEMDPEEKQLRMQRMRKVVREHNVYRWAAGLIGELCELRLDISEEGKEKTGRKRSLPLRDDKEKKAVPLVDNQVELERFMSAVGCSRLAALLLDYDGTLAPFSADRHRGLPYPGVVRLLQEIMAEGRTRVVVITGRSALEVISLLGIYPAPEIWGSHGLQRLRPDGSCEMPRLDSDVSQALSDASQWLAQQGFQYLAELKPGAIAVHWRGLPEPIAMEVRDRVLRGWFPVAQRALMSVLEFDGGVEMRMPDLDKGDAVRTVISEMDSDAPIAYLGDDATDEHAFDALGTRGLSLLVRPEWRETSARLWLKPPDDLLDFLTRWRQASRRIKAPSGGAVLSK